MKTRVSTVILALAAVAFTTPLAAQTVQFDLGVGYQWLDVSGNEQLYKTQSGQQVGTVLDSFNLSLVDTKGETFFDRLTVAAAGVGHSPDTSFKLALTRQKQFDVRLSYNRNDIYSFIPDFANPMLAAGVTPGQHTMNRKREGINLDVQILPGTAITPLLGYTRQTYKGTGTSTYFVGEDEFKLDSELDEKVTEARAGVAFAAGGFRGTILQGWRSLSSSNYLNLSTGGGNGNNSFPVMGHNVHADTLGLSSKTDTKTPFTNAYVTGKLTGNLRLVASYVRSKGTTDDDQTGDVAGDLVSFKLNRYFTSLDNQGTSTVKNTTWNGGVRLEADLSNAIELQVGYSRNHRELDGHSLATLDYLGTTKYNGLDPKNIHFAIDSTTAWQRDEDVLDGRLVARPASWLSLWVAYANAIQNVKVTPDAAEIVVPGGQGGDFDRSIRRYSAGAETKFTGFNFGVDWARDEGDNATLRTDFATKKRLRGRVGFDVSSYAHFSAVADKTEGANPTPGINLDYDVTHWAADLDVTPVESLVIHAGYDHYDGSSSIVVRDPGDFSLDPWMYVEQGKSYEGSVSFKINTLSFSFGGSNYTNEGNHPFELKSTIGRFDFSCTETIGVYGQIERRSYSESLLPLAAYDADRYAIFVRFRTE